MLGGGGGLCLASPISIVHPGPPELRLAGPEAENLSQNLSQNLSLLLLLHRSNSFIFPFLFVVSSLCGCLYFVSVSLKFFNLCFFFPTL